LKKVIFTIAAALLSVSAFADGRSAVHNLFVNLARAKASLNENEVNLMVAPTLVRGVYAISNQQKRFVGFTNEAGTLFGDSRGFNMLSVNGAQPRSLTIDETAGLRSEVVSAIDFDKLPKITHGEGGGRRIVLFSAVDCPACKWFEDTMRKFGNNVNTTFYVVPSSLQEIAKGGIQPWQAVSRLWCAEDSGAAWQAFWASRRIPQPRQCQFADPRTAEMAEQQLKDILQAVGARVEGTPQIFFEDGTIVRNKANIDVAYANSVFGPAGMPQTNTRPARWLLASADDNSQILPVGGQSANAANPQQQHNKFGVNDALKKLLGK